MLTLPTTPFTASDLDDFLENPVSRPVTSTSALLVPTVAPGGRSVTDATHPLAGGDGDRTDGPANPDGVPGTSVRIVDHRGRPDGSPRTFMQTGQERLDERLYTHAMRGRIPEVQQVLLEGANLHAKEDNALRAAAGGARLEMVALLLDAGADLTARDHHALRLAARGGHREVAVLLLERGADLSAVGFEALRLAVEHGRATTVTAFLEHARTIGLVIPLDVMEQADRSSPAGAVVKHAAARQALAPALQEARVLRERQVLHAEVDAALDGQTGRALPFRRL